MNQLNQRKKTILQIIGLLLVVFLALYIIYILSHSVKETFLTKNGEIKDKKSRLIFLKPIDIYAIILKSGYFGKFNKINMKARLCANMEDCQLKYRQEFMDIDVMEQEAIEWLLIKVFRKLESVNKSLANLLFDRVLKFAKSSVRLEGNMPHTHADVVILPSYMYEKLWKIYQDEKNRGSSMVDYAIREIGGTIIHELCHILQRERLYNNFDKLYKDWGFERFRDGDVWGIEKVFGMSRLNPDGIDMKWIWNDKYCKKPFGVDKKQKYFVFSAVFQNLEPKYLTHVSNNSYELEKTSGFGYKYKLISAGDIKLNKSFQTYFNLGNNNYHPNEISAEYMSIHCLDLMGLENNGLDDVDGYKTFIKWVNNF